MTEADFVAALGELTRPARARVLVAIVRRRGREKSELMTTTEVAWHFGVRILAVKTWIAKGLLKVACWHNRHRMIRRSDVLAFKRPRRGWKLGRKRK